MQQSYSQQYSSGVGRPTKHLTGTYLSPDANPTFQLLSQTHPWVRFASHVVVSMVAISSPYEYAVLDNGNAAGSFAICLAFKHLPRPLQSLGHFNRSQARPANPSKHTHAPVSRSHKPLPEHSRGACAAVAEAGTLVPSVEPLGHILTSHRGLLCKETSVS